MRLGPVVVLTLSLTLSLAATAGCAAERKGAGGGARPTEEIVVGGILTKTSATGYSTGEAEIGAKARFDRVNAEGGVHGRKIKFIGAKDDGLDPAKGDAAAKELVQREKAFAIVPISAPQFGGATFLEQQKVPFIGWATGPQWCGTKYGFGYNGCLAPKVGAGSQTWWGHQVAAQLGGAAGKSVFVQGTDSSGSKYGVQTISQSFKAAGFGSAGTSAAIPSQAPPADWLPYVNKIMSGKPDVVVSVMAGGKFNTGLYGALRRAGYTGAITDATSYDPKILADPAAKEALQGVLAAPMFEPFESDNPAVAAMKADIRKVAGDSVVYSQHMAVGYWSADLLVKMLDKAGKDLKAEGIGDGFRYSSDGVGTTEFPKHQSEPNGCGALVKVDGDKFAVARSLKCFPNTVLT